MVRTAAIVLAIGFVLFYIIHSPDHAANIVSDAWNGLGDVAHGIGRFFDKLSS